MMIRYFTSFATLLAFSLLFVGPLLAAEPSPEICLPRDDRKESNLVAGFLEQTLLEHGQHGFSRPLKAKAKAGAIAFLEQRILDKRSEFCADLLKVAEGIKAAPTQNNNPSCAGAAIVELLDNYMSKVAVAFNENRTALAGLRDNHVRELKLILFDIARGSTAGLDGSFGGYALIAAPKAVKFEWLKQEASKLGGEAQAAWGAAEPDRNPLVQQNLVFAREAARARQERDAARLRFHLEGKPNPICKPK